MGIGLLLGVIAVTLVIEMKSLLIGEAASAAVVNEIRGTIEGSDSVRRVIHMRTQHLGPEELLVGAKLELDAGLDFREVASAINRAEAAVRAAVPSARVIYLEPDYTRPEEARSESTTGGG